MKNLQLVSMIGILIIVGVIGYFLLSLKGTSAPLAETPLRETTPSPVAGLDRETNSEVDALRAGGSSHLDSQWVYSFLYPADYQLDSGNGDNYTRISKRAVTSRPQSEISDGVLLVFESIDLQGQSLSDFVRARIQESTADGTVQILQPMTAANLNEYGGFTYEVRSLGSSTYLVLQKNAQSNHAVSITYLVSDPQQQGYQSQVEAILSTLELQK